MTTRRERRQSRLGIWSFALALTGLAGVIGMVAHGASLAADDPELFEQDRGMLVGYGLMMVLSLLVELVALGLAIGGLSQRRRRRHLAVAGFIIAGAVLLFPLMR